MTQAEEIVGKLSKPMTRVLLASGDEWFPAAALTARLVASAGSLLTILHGKGLFDRRSDPDVLGRGQYRLTPLGLAVRDALKAQP